MHHRITVAGNLKKGSARGSLHNFLMSISQLIISIINFNRVLTAVGENETQPHVCITYYIVYTTQSVHIIVCIMYNIIGIIVVDTRLFNSIMHLCITEHKYYENVKIKTQ